MISRLFAFLRRERAYLILILLMMAIMGSLRLVSEAAPPLEQETEAFDQYRQAEQKMMSEVEAGKSLKHLLEQEPRLLRVFQGLIFFAAAVFSLGLIILFSLVFSPGFRRRLARDNPVSETTVWTFGMLVRVLILFFSVTMVLGIYFSYIRQFFLPNVSMNYFVILQTIFMDIACIGFIVYIVRKSGGDWRDLGLRLPKGGLWKEIQVGLYGYLGVFPVFVVVVLFLVFLAHLFGYEPPPHPLVYVFLEEEEKAPGAIAASLFLATVLGPVLEEIFFRGFCYPIFRKKWGVGIGMVVTSGLFAAIHQNSFAFWPIFVLGMGLVYVYEKRRCLIAPVALHMVHNVAFVFYFFLVKRIIETAAGM